MSRDLQKDLELCDKATPGPWRDDYNDGDWGASIESEETLVQVATTRQMELGYRQSGRGEFIAAAREGWPESIRRALTAEAEVQRLREALEKICNHRIPCFNDEGEEMGYTIPPAYIREIAREALEVRE